MNFLSAEVVGIVPMLAVMFATGIFAGVLAGLLGVGGGILVVPILEFVLGLTGTDPDIRMHIAVGTSLAIIIPTSVSSFLAHKKRHSVDILLVRSWATFVFLGSTLGTWLASQTSSGQLAALFSVMTLVVAAKMLLPLDGYRLADKPPQGVVSSCLPLSIGTLSSMLGIGGGTLSVPVLTLCNVPVHRAVGTAAAFGLFVSVPGALGFVVSGYYAKNLPLGNFGYVNAFGFIIIAPIAYFAAPLGARVAHYLSKYQLKVVFGFFLITVSARMFYAALSA